ncbi:hypothetical protein PENTCL1PPCAC_21101 [Pristionchus entomophagus]|uniref:Uncharacterized protein n=1 Tax=Pristionchus entomophagus TaxID=358040 RepID=A0AAV5TWT9_9BILA|nr:hypothetical protein PENTCL1PPCAC_21101 [Pristionchus entomophagus]
MQTHERNPTDFCQIRYVCTRVRSIPHQIESHAPTALRSHLCLSLAIFQLEADFDGCGKAKY